MTTRLRPGRQHPHDVSPDDSDDAREAEEREREAREEARMLDAEIGIPDGR